MLHIQHKGRYVALCRAGRWGTSIQKNIEGLKWLWALVTMENSKQVITASVASDPARKFIDSMASDPARKLIDSMARPSGIADFLKSAERVGMSDPTRKFMDNMEGPGS